ncbi:MAG: PKD domain-containing protein, partial [Solirubrobacteraceae bacterium]
AQPVLIVAPRANSQKVHGMSVSSVRAVASRKTWWAALLVALATTCALAPRAGAVLVHWGAKGSKQVAGVLPRRGVKPASIPGSFAHHQAASSAAPTNGTLSYHGGPVLHAESPYLIFWDPSNQITSTEKGLLSRYLADAAAASGQSSNIYGVDRQFTDTTGFADYNQTWSSTHAITDTQAYPSSGQCNVSARVVVPTCLYDSQIQAEVARLVNAQGLPTGTSGSAPIYFVVTPPNVDTCNTGDTTTCADNVYCAYHGIFSASRHNILYADMPTYLASNDPKGCQADGNTQVQAPNGNQITDVVTSSMSHELSETITDPITDSNLGAGGWYDPISGNEDGDNCAFTGSPSDPARDVNTDAFRPALGGSASSGTLYDQVINGGQYYTQTEWSNGNTTCEAQPVAATLTPAFSSPPAVVPGSPVAFDPSGSSSDAGFTSTSWSFGDGGTSFAPSGPATVNHTFASLGTYTVKLTVVDANGNLSTFSHTITVTSTIADFTVSPANPRAGASATYDASSSIDTVGTLNSYTWHWGDGSPDTQSTTPTTTHIFTTPGVYSVTLTVSDGPNTASTTRQVTVDVPTPAASAPPAPPPTAIVGSPSAAISVTTARPIAGTTTAFSGSGSSAPGSTLVAYGWTFGDGGSATGVTPGHRFAHPGTYTVTLTVRDATGATATSSRRVTVKSAGITGVKIRTGKTVERLTLSLSGPGTLTWGKLRFKIKQAGNLVAKLKLTKAQRARLSPQRSLKIKLTFKFKPTVGSSSSKTVSFKVKG